jgi:hypothetical protein
VGITNAPSPVAVMTAGLNNATFGPWPIPVPLFGFGMPGCDLWHSAEVFGLAVTFTGSATATFDQPVPNNVALAGSHLYVQAFALAPGANPMQVTTSNGLDWHIGY